MVAQTLETQTQQTMNQLAIVILNWNGEKLLEQFLPSVTAYSQEPWAEVVVADNASTDNSIAFVRDNYPDIKIISLDKNYGFAEGYNRALTQLSHHYFVLLNSDIEVTKDWLKPIYQQMENDTTIGAVQPKIKAFHNKKAFEYAGAAGGFIDYLGYPFCRGRILDVIENDNGQYDKTIPVFWASGAAMFVRSELYKELGGLDADFFAHMEEIDLCWRINSRKFKVFCNSESTVFHVGGATLSNTSPRKLYLNFRNNLLMLYKNLPANKLFPIIFIRMILDGVAAFQFLLKGEFSNFGAVFKAHISFYKNIKLFRKKRKIVQQAVTPKQPLPIYKNSIIFDYFIRKKRKFSDLKGI